MADLSAIPANRSTPGLRLHKHKQSPTLILLDLECVPPKGVRESPFTWLNWKPVPRASRPGNQLAVQCGALLGGCSESLAGGSRSAAVVVVGKDALTGAW